MYYVHAFIAAVAVLSNVASAGNCKRAEVEPRGGDVQACKLVLLAMKASAFCSSFVPITDATATVTQTGTAASQQVTITAPCTNAQGQKRAPTTTTSAAPSTTPAAPSTTAKVSTTSSKSSSKTTTTSTTISKCDIQGLPKQIDMFACKIVKQACIELVQPKTVTVTTYQPGPTVTGTKSVTPTCSTTPSTTPSTTTTTTTTSALPTEPRETCNPNAGPKGTADCPDGSKCTAPETCYVYPEGADVCFNSCTYPCLSSVFTSGPNYCYKYYDCCPGGGGRRKLLVREAQLNNAGLSY